MASLVLIHRGKLRLGAGSTLLEFMRKPHQALPGRSSPLWVGLGPGRLRAHEG